MMRSMSALIHREFLEHRGAFLIAPLVLLAIFAVAFGSAVTFSDTRIPAVVIGTSVLGLLEAGLLIVGALWLFYLLVALFFYYADAFNADRRNNSMLFWKSMPLSDFKVLGSKMLAGLTLFPALIFLVFVMTGIVILVLGALAVGALPGLEFPGVTEVIGSAVQVGLFSLVYIFLALLWYAPFFAWVGALSTVVGRWSIPLAFLVPGLVVLVENLFFRGIGTIIGSLLMPNGSPAGGYVADYLGNRFQFGFHEDELPRQLIGADRFDALSVMGRLFATIDWSQMAIGVAVAAVLVWIASEYRRRIIVA